MIRTLLPLTALLSLFFFPYPLSALLILASAIMLPVSGIVLGVAADVLYFSPGAAFMPLWSLGGIFATVLALLVQRFVKTRIMDT